jgi:hypothetical protein
MYLEWILLSVREDMNQMLATARVRDSPLHHIDR